MLSSKLLPECDRRGSSPQPLTFNTLSQEQRFLEVRLLFAEHRQSMDTERSTRMGSVTFQVAEVEL